MRRLGAWFLVVAALIWLGACSRDTPATDTVPDSEQEEPLLADAPLHDEGLPPA